MYYSGSGPDGQPFFGAVTCCFYATFSTFSVVFSPQIVVLR